MIPADEFAAQIPPEITFKNARNGSNGFASTLWNILKWIDNDEFKAINLGLKWVTDDEFKIDKKRFCEITRIPLNTLNCKFRLLQFQQSRKRQNSSAFYKCDLFKINSTPENLAEIDQRRNVSEDHNSVVPQAMFLPLLDSVRIFTTKAFEIPFFRCDAILLWQEIIGKPFIWSVDLTEFVNAAAIHFCQAYQSAQETVRPQTSNTRDLNLNRTEIHPNTLDPVISTVTPSVVSPEFLNPPIIPMVSPVQDDLIMSVNPIGLPPIVNVEQNQVGLQPNNTENMNSSRSMYNSQQTEFAQYIKNTHLNFEKVARQMISYMLNTTQKGIVSLLDFCMLFARFGPDDSVLEKIHQLLCCSRSYGDWFQPYEQKFDESRALSGSYSKTFANCFIIKRTQQFNYHIYNLSNVSSNNGFLVDEAGKKFLSWHAVFEFLNVPNPISYGGIPMFEQTDFPTIPL